MRFGDMLPLWMTYRGLLGKELAAKCEPPISSTYLSEVINGSIETAGREKRDSILRALKVDSLEEYFAGPPRHETLPKEFDLGKALEEGKIRITNQGEKLHPALERMVRDLLKLRPPDPDK